MLLLNQQSCIIFKISNNVHLLNYVSYIIVDLFSDIVLLECNTVK